MSILGVCVSCSQLGDVTSTITIAPGQESTVQELLKGEWGSDRGLPWPQPTLHG
jgi:hypothetical protein